MSIIPRWYQQEAIESIFKYYEDNSGNPVVVMPTGTGKSIVIAEFVRLIFSYWSSQRVLVLTHVKELVEQNSKKLVSVWPLAPMGINCAKLKRRDLVQPVIFASSGSIRRYCQELGHRDLVIIDEAHRVSQKDSSDYRRIIAELSLINPKLKVIGLTATHYRLGQGLITDDGLFTDICYNLSSRENYNRLVREGYLAPHIGKRTVAKIDTDGIKISKGDFSEKELSAAADKEDLNYSIVQEICYMGADRNCWMVFATSIEHAIHLSDLFSAFGVSSAAIHSNLSDTERTELIDAYKAGEIKVLVNRDILTTGFDHPPIDLIAVVTATMSPNKWVQMLGRGGRPSPETGKIDCRVMDFGRNAERLGPINDPVIPRKKGKGTGDPPIKICPDCETYLHPTARECPMCGHIFEFKSKLTPESGTGEVMRSDLPEYGEFEIRKIIYNRHAKANSKPSIKVSYYSGVRVFKEWICPEHDGYAGKKFRDWWRTRDFSEPPKTVEEFLERSHELKQPERIKVIVNQKYPTIVKYFFKVNEN